MPASAFTSTLYQLKGPTVHLMLTQTFAIQVRSFALHLYPDIFGQLGELRTASSTQRGIAVITDTMFLSCCNSASMVQPLFISLQVAAFVLQCR